MSATTASLASISLPAGACDCHMHIYDGRFPSAPGATLLPADALVPAYLEARASLGLSRCVVVTPSTYGFDNRCTAAALRALNFEHDCARGIAVINAMVDDATLDALHADGFRGARFNQTLGASSLDDLEPLAERLAPRGWHLEVLLPSAAWPDITDRLQRLMQTTGVPLVFDHFGRLPHPARQNPGHKAILRLLDTGSAWVKLSGAYLHQQVPRTEWHAQALAMTQDYLRIAPHRLVWGSNWPHPSVSAGIHDAVADQDLLALLRASLGDNATLHTILVDNPCELYDFRTP